jgi:hypothetical protein
MDRMQDKNEWCFSCAHAPVACAYAMAQVVVRSVNSVGDYLAQMYNNSREGQNYETAMKNHLNRLFKTCSLVWTRYIIFFVSRNGSHLRDMAFPCNQIHNVGQYRVSKTRPAPNRVTVGGQGEPAARFSTRGVIHNKLRYTPMPNDPGLSPAGHNTHTLSIRACRPQYTYPVNSGPHWVYDPGTSSTSGI